MIKSGASVCEKSITMLMNIKRIAKAGITHPFGDERSVQQAFPSGISEKEADPFLMCDYFHAPVEEQRSSKEEDEDHFPVNWHPHKGFSIASYLKSGVGRHGDSLGNRETFETPGMQWMNTGSGVEHAEGGGGGSENSNSEPVEGFQIWINVPSQHKLDDPEYGTVDPSLLPTIPVGDDGTVKARVLAGTLFDTTGPFQTKQPVQMVDFDFSESSAVEFDIANGLDTAILYVYKGSLSKINDQEEMVPPQSVILLDAVTAPDRRGIRMEATRTTTNDEDDEQNVGVLLFAGKKIREPIAWHGPIVMNTQEEIYETFRDIRSGKFPPVRVDWDYKRIATKPTTIS